jgi:hypothetical protein
MGYFCILNIQMKTKNWCRVIQIIHLIILCNLFDPIFAGKRQCAQKQFGDYGVHFWLGIFIGCLLQNCITRLECVLESQLKPI